MSADKNITATFLPNVYTWNQTSPGLWTTSTNWTPTRFTPSNDDQLNFSGGGTVLVTAVPTQTIGQLLLSNNSTVNMQSSAAVVLTIAGGTGTDLDIPAGSTLGWGATAAANAINIALGSSATATVAGQITVGGAGAGTAHRLTALGSGAIHFKSGA